MLILLVERLERINKYRLADESSKAISQAFRDSPDGSLGAAPVPENPAFLDATLTALRPMINKGSDDLCLSCLPNRISKTNETAVWHEVLGGVRGRVGSYIDCVNPIPSALGLGPGLSNRDLVLYYLYSRHIHAGLDLKREVVLMILDGIKGGCESKLIHLAVKLTQDLDPLIEASQALLDGLQQPDRLGS